MDVFGRSMEPTPGAQEPGVHPDRARRPHLAGTASFGAEQSVERPVGVGDDVEAEMEVLSVRTEAFRGGEGDDGDPGVTELVEVIAHGDHVFLAGQSSKVAVQDQHDGPAAHLGGAPRPTLVIDEFYVRKRVTDVEGHAIPPVRTDRRNQGRRLEDAGPLAWPATTRTRRALGLTMCTSPIARASTVESVCGVSGPALIGAPRTVRHRWRRARRYR